MGDNLVWKSWRAGPGGPGGRTTKMDRVEAQEDESQTENKRMIEFSMVKNLIMVGVTTFPCLEGRTMTRCLKLEIVV